MYLQDGGATHAANEFWKIDGRNPLLAWWYVAVRPFILSHRASFLELHLVTTLALAISEYLLVVSLTNGRQKALALALGLTTATFISGARIDNITWVLTAVMACSILSVFCFSEFLNSGRTKYPWLTASVVFWMLAVQSYSIQSGAVFSIFALSFLDGQKPFLRRSITAIGDVIPYLTLFVMFVLFWRTVAPVNASTIASFDFWRMIASLRQAIWHDNELLTIKTEIGYLGTFVATSIFVAALMGFVAIQFVFLKEAPKRSGFDLLKIALVAAGIALPTLLVESSSIDYPAGSRWVLLEQFWFPFIVLTPLAALLMLALDWVVRPAWIACTSAVAAYGFLATLAFTSLVHNISVHEEIFMNDLRRIVSEDHQSGALFPRAYFIKDFSKNFSPSDWVDLPYAKTEGISDIRFRFIRTGTPGPLPLTFTDEVIENPQTNWFPKPASYDHASLLSWDGLHFQRIRSADADTFKGTDAIWKRSHSLIVPDAH